MCERGRCMHCSQKDVEIVSCGLCQSCSSKMRQDDFSRTLYKIENGEREIRRLEWDNRLGQAIIQKMQEEARERKGGGKPLSERIADTPGLTVSPAFMAQIKKSEEE